MDPVPFTLYKAQQNCCSIHLFVIYRTFFKARGNLFANLICKKFLDIQKIKFMYILWFFL